MKNLKFVFVLLAVLALSACVAAPAVAPQSAVAQGLVSLPDDARTLILTLLTAAFAWLLAKINMGQFTQPIAAALAPVIILAIENLLGMIPPSFDNIVLAILHWLVLFISGSIGALVLAKRAKTPKTLLDG